MNVEGSSFNARLPSILKHIARSHFVTFDLELSGIPAQRRRDALGKQNLEERYQELKIAAEKYHILQVGLTCVEEDRESNKYLIRSYNFNISPLIAHGIDIDREFTYSASAVDFLLNHGFQIDAPIRLGVPYLSPSETASAEERAKAQRDRSAIPDMEINPSDKESLSFMDSVRDEINSWQRLPKPSKTQCLVGVPSNSVSGTKQKAPLSRFQRRLVHQLVRREYSDLSTGSKGDFVQVFKKDAQIEASQNNWMQRRHEDSLFLQTGFRWVVDALTGGTLSEIKPDLCGPSISGEPDPPNPKRFEERLKELENTLKNRKTILVGHNCFLDLIYFYNSFIGKLPATIKEFQGVIHEIFPLVIDTKYMATNGPEGDIFRAAQLSQIDEALSNQRVPAFDFPEDHPTYSGAERYHEAGFDSYATAKVMLRLAGKLSAEAKSSDRMEIVSSSQGTSNLVKYPEIRDTSSHADSSVENINPEGSKARQKVKTKPKIPSTGRDANRTKYASTNIFEQLNDALDEGRNSLSAETPASSSSMVQPADKESLSVHASSTAPRSLIPEWDSQFWKERGNKLRVYGTVEEVCDLAGEPLSASSSEVGGEVVPAEHPGEQRPSVISSLVERWKNLVVL